VPPRIVNLSYGWMWVVLFTQRSFYFRERSICTNRIRGLMFLWVDLGTVETMASIRNVTHISRTCCPCPGHYKDWTNLRRNKFLQKHSNVLFSCHYGLENREYGREEPLLWPRDTLYPQTFSLTSLTSGGRSVGIVGLRTKATELVS
jgi:hypothetical protein